MPRTALIIRHIQFEGAGTFEDDLKAAGYAFRYIDAWRGDFLDIDQADLLVVMGGPIGVYQTEDYPFLVPEVAAVRERLKLGKPTIGVCLGSQIIAAALGARVYPGHGPEIGWAPVTLTAEGKASPLSEIEGLSVLHWHGDTFDLPKDCELLASTGAYAHQAFRRGDNLLALQFHPEVTADTQESWLVGNVTSLVADRIKPQDLRDQAARHDAKLREPASRLMRRWLAGLD